MKRKCIPQTNTKKRVRKGNGEWPLDVFDENQKLDIETDVCALCRQGHDFGLLLKRYLDTEREEGDFSNNPTADVDGVWISKFSLAGKGRTFVHFYCAFTCPRAWFTTEGIWRGVQQEVSRGRHFHCTDCKQKGATIGCLLTSCSVIMHLPCAMKNGFQMSRYTNNNFKCRKHCREEEKADKERQEKMARDFTNGKEKIAIDWINTVDELKPSDNFTYVTENIDSDDLVLNSRSVHNLPCCSCTDMCADASKCECLQSGRNYTVKGQLAPEIILNSQHKIVECNLRCNCSIRRCTNRVVSKGVAVPFELFRVTNDREHHWGVRLLETVEANSFICEIAGQAKKPSHPPTRYQYNLPSFGKVTSDHSNNSSSSNSNDSEVYCIDCTEYGNISHFIRSRPEGSSPMLRKKYIYPSHSEEAIPRIALFSTRTILSGQELLL